MFSPLFHPSRFAFRSGRTTLAVLAFLSTAALGQDQTASLTGVFQSPGGSPVPGISVAVVNLRSGERLTVQTDDTGRFRASSLILASYRVEAEPPGATRLEFKVEIAQAGQAVDLGTLIVSPATAAVVSPAPAAVPSSAEAPPAQAEKPIDPVYEQ